MLQDGGKCMVESLSSNFLASNTLTQPSGSKIEGPFVVPPYMPDPTTFHAEGAILDLYIPYVNGPKAAQGLKGLKGTYFKISIDNCGTLNRKTKCQEKHE